MHRLSMEQPGGVEVNWGSHDEKSPFHGVACPAYIGSFRYFLPGLLLDTNDM